MSALAFEVWDVFTDVPFAGNQLAVIPDARGLSTARMQAIAREFNFSETAFVLPPETRNGTARVRIFDPAHELPFAGHPTIGTAISLVARGVTPGPDLVLEEGVGPIPCSVAQSGGAWHGAFVTDAPFSTLGEIDTALAADCLSLTVDHVRSDRHAPMLASKGLPFACVELTDAAALNATIPDTAAMRKADARHPSDVDFFAIYAYCREAEDRIAARMFAPLSGIPEDPATGSAAAALAALLCATGRSDVDLSIRQGVAMGRPSTIRASAREGGAHVRISGAAVQTMTGTISVATTDAGD